MEDLYTMSSGTIPPFGSWGYADELSYTHYLSCAAEAAAGFNCYSPYRAPEDLYAVDFRPYDDTPSKKKKVVGKERRKQKVRKEYNNAGHHKQQQPQKPSLMKQPRTKKFDSERQGEAKCKPVDEDLYKIPPELIHAYKRVRSEIKEARILHILREAIVVVDRLTNFAHDFGSTISTQVYN